MCRVSPGQHTLYHLNSNSRLSCFDYSYALDIFLLIFSSLSRYCLKQYLFSSKALSRLTHQFIFVFGLEISALIAGVICAYKSVADKLKERKERKEKKAVELEESLGIGPPAIQNKYEYGVVRLGDRVPKGDGQLDPALLKNSSLLD
jgi:hypothetical protein